MAQAYVFQVLPDILGLPDEGREHMHGFSEMVWATMGPPGELFDQAMQHDYSAVIDWLETKCERSALDPEGIGETIYAAVGRGQVTLAEAKLLLQTVLSAGADTTFITMANALRAWALFPGEYAQAARRAEESPRRVRRIAALGSPSRMAGRMATRDVEIDDYTVPAGSKVGLMFAAANRDPRYWDAPDEYRLDRDTQHSLGWGYGVHGCVGRVLATMEAQALLGEIVAAGGEHRARRALRAVDDHRRPRTHPPAGQAQLRLS